MKAIQKAELMRIAIREIESAREIVALVLQDDNAATNGTSSAFDTIIYGAGMHPHSLEDLAASYEEAAQEDDS